MSTWVIAAYGGSFLLALILLYFTRSQRWYWHILSLVAGLGIGLMPIPVQLNTPRGTLIIGSAFTFLVVWGVAAPLFRRRGHSI